MDLLADIDDLLSEHTTTSVFQHNQHRFPCGECEASFSSFIILEDHRKMDHPFSMFKDYFYSGCRCNKRFGTQLQATQHTSECPKTKRLTDFIPANLSCNRQTKAELNKTVFIKKNSSKNTKNPSSSSSKANLDISASSSSSSFSGTFIFNPNNLSSPSSDPIIPTPNDGTVNSVSNLTSTEEADDEDDSSTIANIPHNLSTQSSKRKRKEAQEDEVHDIARRRISPQSSESILDQLSNDINTSNQNSKFTLRFDGACKKNPGIGGSGAVIYRNNTIIWKHHEFFNNTTNNIAEYMGLINGLQGATHLKIESLEIEGDSKMVIEQLNGTMRVKAQHIRELRKKSMDLCSNFKEISFIHIDRKLNSIADKLANTAMKLRQNIVECTCELCPKDPVILNNFSKQNSKKTNSPQPSVTTTSTNNNPANKTIKNCPGLSCSGGIDDDLISCSICPTKIHYGCAIDDSLNVTEENSNLLFCSTKCQKKRKQMLEDAAITYERSPPDFKAQIYLNKMIKENDEDLKKKILDISQKYAVEITDSATWNDAENKIDHFTHSLYSILSSASKKTNNLSKNNNENPISQSPNQQQATNSSNGTNNNLSGNNNEFIEEESQISDYNNISKSSNRKINDFNSRPIEDRIKEAVDDLQAILRSSTKSKKEISRARRRIGRLKSAKRRYNLRNLFMKNEKKCVYSILNETSDQDSKCNISPDIIYKNYKEIHEANSSFNSESVLGNFFTTLLDQLPVANHLDILSNQLDDEEIDDVILAASKSSSPGLDGIPYVVYQRFLPQLKHVIYSIFQRCFESKQIPASWKYSTTVLLYKKGDLNLISNWRPICLQQSLYKLYTSVLSNRFMLWMEKNERLSASQKGFRNFNGCHEHNFLATSLMDSSRRLHKKLYVIWYDLKNAFGSIPHDYLWLVLKKMGLPSSFLLIIQNIYKDSFFNVKTNSGSTDWIKNLNGVYQGCPLSPRLFIAAMEPLLLALNSLQNTGINFGEVKNLNNAAFADDLKVFSRTPEGITTLHKMVCRFLKWTTMVANPKKCSFLAVSKTENYRFTEDPIELSIEGKNIPKLSLTESYNYLGTGDGFDHVRTRFMLLDEIKLLKKQASLILKSSLAPWQKLKAIKVYLYSKLDYPLRNTRPMVKDLISFDKYLIKGVKHMLKLPKLSTNEIMYSPISSGGLGFLPLSEYHAALQITHGLQMLNSPDKIVAEIARNQLMDIVKARFILSEDDNELVESEVILKFLNQKLILEPYAAKKRSSTDRCSMWIDIQRHLKTFNLQLELDNYKNFTLKVPHHSKYLDSKSLARQLKLHLRIRHFNQWKSMIDQGNTTSLHGDAGSAFLSRGGLYDQDYIFAIKGRLNQVPTRSVQKHYRARNNNTCRRSNCSRIESLAHILNHCPANDAGIRFRHDKALKKIEYSIKKSPINSNKKLLIDEEVPNYDGEKKLRPDIQLYDEENKIAYISDLKIAFEADNSFTDSKNNKIQKYQVIKEFLERRGYKVHVSAIIYGSLGSVYGGNFNVFTEHLGLLKGVAKRLDIKLSQQNISQSRRIWAHHSRNSNFTSNNSILASGGRLNSNRG